MTSPPREDVGDAGDDRIMKDVIPPPRLPLAHHRLFGPEGIRLDVLKEHLFKEGRLLKEDAMYLARSCQSIFRKEPNLLTLDDPITVCGDVHGQFFDLLRLIEAGGDPAKTKYLFLGDYVDRGCFSTECLFYLFAHKITYTDTFWMLRGNHECRHLTAFFNFKDECVYKYDLELYDAITECFDTLPIAATINSKFLACHGGLSPDISDLKDIQNIDRFREVPRDGPFCDLLWADPVDDEKEEEQMSEGSDSEHLPTTWFAYNQTRQCSYVFGVDAVTTFLNKNGLTAIIRAHEACFDGYKFLFVSEQTQIPRVITIFSAPNYCDVYKNKGACLKFSDDLLNIRQYVCSPHPYYLPNFMDVFAWSLPFVAEKVCDMLFNVISFGQREEAKKKKENTKSTVIEGRGHILRDKVLAVSKLMKVYNVIREEQENIVKLKALSPSGRLPNGILTKGSKAISNAVTSFESARNADLENEKLPGMIKRTYTGEQVGFRDGSGLDESGDMSAEV